MGEARRRKAALGNKYGTPDFAKDQPIQLREMPQEEIERLDLLAYSTDSRFWLLIGSVSGTDYPLIVEPVLDNAGRMNSYVKTFYAQGSTPKILTGSRQIADIKAINRYLLDQADVIIINETH
jgi:hypothetical protein